MAGIYIEGLSIPTDEYGQLVFVRRDGKVVSYVKGKETVISKAVNVPNHGDLIDKEELFRAAEHQRDHHTHTDGLAARHHKAEFNHFLNMIAYAPTIIPEDKEEDK